MRNIELIAQALKDAGIVDANPATFKSKSAWKRSNMVPKEDAIPIRVKLWCGSNGKYITKWTELYGPEQVKEIE